MIMLGTPCSPCCGTAENCPADGKSRTDPKNEGTWTPAGSWPNPTWTFQANPGDYSGRTWFFFGSQQTSKAGALATTAEIQDWYNLCNWYSAVDRDPASFSQASHLTRRASRLPPVNAIVHVYSSIDTSSNGPVTVDYMYVWSGDILSASNITTTSAAYGTTYGTVFRNGVSRMDGVLSGGALFIAGGAGNFGTISQGAEFQDTSRNRSGATVNGGAVFRAFAINDGTVYGGGTFSDDAQNWSIVNGGATFNNRAFNTATTGVVNGGAIFEDDSTNQAVVNDGATFNDNSSNNQNTTGSLQGVVNAGATFNSTARNFTTINGGATFNNNAEFRNGVVNGGATFNDAACSRWVLGGTFFCPAGANRRRFVAHLTDLPTCNGTAPTGCGAPTAGCGCG